MMRRVKELVEHDNLERCWRELEWILVTAQVHWNQPLKSQSEVAAVQLYVALWLPTPVGRDAEILELTKKICENAQWDNPARSLLTGGAFSQELLEMGKE